MGARKENKPHWPFSTHIQNNENQGIHFFGAELGKLSVGNQSASAVSSIISWQSEFQYESNLLKLRITLFKSLLKFSILKFDSLVSETL
jgi:hypothetical protein